MKKWSLKGLWLFAIGYGGLVLLIAACQNQMLYHPRVSAEPVLLQRAGELGVQPWRDAAGRLIGWRKPNHEAHARLLVLHGNAIDAVERASYLQTFNALGGGIQWETFVLEYPGYGARPGPLGRAAFLAAGRAALAELRAADRRPVFLLGESLGSGPATTLAGEFPDAIAGVLLVVPFARLAEVGQNKMPFLPVKLLLRDDYDNIAALAKYHGPVAIVVADRDEVVGAEQGRKLYASYAGRKLIIELPNTGHNDFHLGPEIPWVNQASEFLAR